MSAENPLLGERTSELGRLIIITGGTGSGKTEIKNGLKERGIRRLVTATSRPPRLGETHGVHYHFYGDRDAFVADIERGRFVEWAEYGGNLYGTPKNEVEALFNGYNLVTSTEIEGAVKFLSSLKDAYNPATLELLLPRITKVFIGVDSLTTIKDRYFEREGKTAFTSSSERSKFRDRLRTDWEMWNRYSSEFDAVVFNQSGKLEETIDTIHKMYDM